MQHQKRVLDLIKITNELERTSTSYRLTVIGEGSEAPALEAAWQRQIANGSIVMTGRLSREMMLAELEQNDVFLLVSEFEGMPISLLEAMARGVVPVVSDIPAGIPELVLQGKTGLVAGVGNAKEFAGHLQTLSRDRELLERLSEAAYSHIKNNGFTDDAMSSSYLSVIESMWTEIISGSYQRPRSISWRTPGGDVSPPGFVLKLADS
jgi:glycosyltransferase involved in cell wall biosynthesis